MWLNNKHSKQYAEKWKPQLLGESLVSLSGVKEYTGVMLKLSSDHTNTGLIRTDANDVLYVIKTENNNTIHLEDVLWGKQNDKKYMFNDLKEWCETFDFTICANLSGIDQDLWVQTF
tara:strand:- start:67 stop:417 length:351 start_codon:yes stop_codon:yes gene_type:complete